MRIHIIKEKTIRKFVLSNASGRESFEEWLNKMKLADWKIPGDIKMTFNSSDLLGKSSNRVIFNVGGNKYRIICKYSFGNKEVHLFICWIGTHSEYDKLCAVDKQYTINLY